MRELLLNAKALIHNLHQVRRLAPTSKVLAMVKANAYGHGLVWAAQHLVAAGVEALGVANVEEACALRDAGLLAVPIVLMSGFQNEEELAIIFQQQLIPVIHQDEQIALLQQSKIQQSLSIWLKVDTGMHRLGFSPDRIQSVYHVLNSLRFIKKPIVLMTHFSDANEVHQSTTAHQLMLFNLARATLSANPLCSLANSAGIVSWPETHSDWIRPGIMLYGASPFDAHLGQDYQLEPVMTVQSRLIAQHYFAAGAAIGYGGTFTCPKPMRIGVVAFGYGDGYPRQALLSEVLIRGHRCQVVGRISMDMLQVDLTPYPEIALGDNVVLWGKDLPVEYLAVAANTIPYEIFCHLQRNRLAVMA